MVGGRHGLAAVGVRSLQSPRKQSTPSVSGRRSTCDGNAHKCTRALLFPRQGTMLHELASQRSQFWANTGRLITALDTTLPPPGPRSESIKKGVEQEVLNHGVKTRQLQCIPAKPVQVSD